VSTNYDWTKSYVAAVLETDPEALANHIETAQRAIGKRVVEAAIDENERRAIVAALNALTLLGRKRCTYPYPKCAQCRDENDVVTPLNGKTFLVETRSGQLVISLHLRCVDAWALGNDCQTLMPLKKPPTVNRTWLRRNIA
jgi:hypothetical protein